MSTSFHLDEKRIKEFENLNLKTNYKREKSSHMNVHWLLKITERVKDLFMQDSVRNFLILMQDSARNFLILMQDSFKNFLNGTCKEIFPPVTSTLNVC